MQKDKSEQHLEEIIRELANNKIPYTVTRSGTTSVFTLKEGSEVYLERADEYQIIEWCKQDVNKRLISKLGRKKLIEYCENAVVDINNWREETAKALEQLGICWVLLKANCIFKIIDKTEDFIRLEIYTPAKLTKESSGAKLRKRLFYVPTIKRLHIKQGKDWS